MSQHNSGPGRKRGNASKGANRPERPAAAAAATVATRAVVDEPAKPAAPAPAATAPVATAPEVAVKAPSPAPAPAAPANPVDAENDALMERFEAANKRYGPAYAAMAEGLRGEGVDKLVKYVQYGLAAAAVFVVVAAVMAA